MHIPTFQRNSKQGMTVSTSRKKQISLCLKSQKVTSKITHNIAPIIHRPELEANQSEKED
jgi:hypothetical protein